MSAASQFVPGSFTLAQLRRVWDEAAVFRLDPSCHKGIARAQAQVTRICERDAAVYGINTGFGSLASQRIPAAQLRELQTKLILSHSTGTGPALPDRVVRLVLALKLSSLGRGHSGVGMPVIAALEQLIERDALPVIPSQGSVGASGDLAPLAHLVATLLGFGSIRIDGEELSASEALAELELKPLQLGPKEGLALINGTQVSTALALDGLFTAQRVFDAALLAGAMSVDAAKGSTTPFDDRIHELRGQRGQREVATKLRELLEGSAIRASHLKCDRVQDPYSLRCQPQVMGACLDQLRHAAKLLHLEANAVTDNPLLFPDRGDVLSGGNFHAEPVAFAADNLALALAEIGNLSERRIALLVDAKMSGLPAFLVREGGLNSGFMIAQVTAAALCSENKSLAHPASVDTIPTSANQEDHVSMATYAARRLRSMAENAATVVGIELLAAAQGIEFHRPLESSAPIERALARLRTIVPGYDEDRYFAPDIDAASALVLAGTWSDLVQFR